MRFDKFVDAGGLQLFFERVRAMPFLECEFLWKEWDRGEELDRAAVLRGNKAVRPVGKAPRDGEIDSGKADSRLPGHDAVRSAEAVAPGKPGFMLVRKPSGAFQQRNRPEIVRFAPSEIRHAQGPVRRQAKAEFREHVILQAFWCMHVQVAHSRG